MTTSELPSGPFPGPVSAPAEDPGVYVRKVGKGRTLLKSLEREEAAAAFSLLLRGGFTDAQAGAFLQALRIKELAPSELDGLMDAFRAARPDSLPALPPGGFVLNLASDTPRKGGYASLLAAALTAAEEGLPAGVIRSEPVLTGNRASWDGTWDLVRNAPAGPFREALHGAGDCGDGCGAPHHAPASLFVAEINDLAPPLRSLRAVRNEIGFRSCLHTAEKLLNPWADKPLILGISHRHYAGRMTEHFAGRGLAAKIVLGNHGTTDLVLHKETEVWEVAADGTVRTTFFHPGELGLRPEANVYSLGGFPQWRDELAKPGCGALGPVLDYHRAFLLYAAGVASHPRDVAPRFTTGVAGVTA